MKCLGLHNKPTSEVQPGHMLTGPKEEEEEECLSVGFFFNFVLFQIKKVSVT
jgi:hypothetical protein